jgi:hypothetical protein
LDDVATNLQQFARESKIHCTALVKRGRTFRQLHKYIKEYNFTVPEFTAHWIAIGATLVRLKTFGRATRECEFVVRENLLTDEFATDSSQ